MDIIGTGAKELDCSVKDSSFDKHVDKPGHGKEDEMVDDGSSIVTVSCKVN